jgi:hypothetical protein
MVDAGTRFFAAIKGRRGYIPFAESRKKIAIVFDGHLIVNSTITREHEATATTTARGTNLPQSIRLNRSGLGAW